MIEREKVISRIKAQIAVCKEIDSDFITLTVGTGKRILELLDESEKEDPADYENGFHDGYQQAMKDMKKVKI
jgi:hypothetical protein